MIKTLAKLPTLFCSLFLFGCLENPIKLETQAKEFGVSMGYEVKGVNCMNYDSDNDGYVSCAVNIGMQEPLQIECSSMYNIISRGCRLVKINMLRRF
jgi:hypothetical protein